MNTRALAAMKPGEALTPLRWHHSLFASEVLERKQKNEDCSDGFRRIRPFRFEICKSDGSRSNSFVPLGI